MASFSAKERRTYQNICHLTQKGVLSLMKDALSSRYEQVVAHPAFVYAIGDIPVALVAHADTVFRIPPAIENFFYDQEKDVIWNPDGAGADDRAGIFAILQILKKYKLKPHVVITTGEESGCIGANKLAIHTPEFPAPLKFMIQLDRRNHNDAVYYDCDNAKFEDFITGFGFKTEWGTLSDISVLAPTWEVAAVNVSVGYEDEHQEIERLHVNWLYETIDKVAQILIHVRDKGDEVPVYDYIPTIYSWHYPTGYHGYSWYDDDYDDWENYAPGYGKCMICQHTDRLENMIPVRYTFSNTKYNICLNCHSRLSNQIVWCKECNQGYYLTMDQAKKVVDINNWVCEDCKNGKHKGFTEIVQSSNPSVTESVYSLGPDEHGSDIHGMGEEQRVVLVKDQLSRLGISRNCNL